jgi:hypothetical protein
MKEKWKRSRYNISNFDKRFPDIVAQEIEEQFGDLRGAKLDRDVCGNFMEPISNVIR